MNTTNNAVNEVNVGDVFCSTWGYEQSNCDFYQVVGLTAGNKSVKVRTINQQVVNNGMMSGEAIPVKDSFVGDIQTKRLKGDGFRVTSFSWAFKTDWNKPHYCSWGH